MYVHNVPIRLPRAVAPRRLGAGILVTLALLSAACSNDSASSITAPSLVSSSNNSQSAGNDRHRGDGRGGVSDFAVLAHTAVSCSGGSITGNVGTNQSLLDAPPGAVTQVGCLINGTIDKGGPAAKAAFLAFQGTYVALRPPVDCPLITGTLANTTLTPGTYCVSSEAKTGVLTLSGNGTFIIKVPGPAGALTGTNFTVALARGAQACNVTWWADAEATMTTSHFQGNILAGAAISMSASTLNGNAWAGASGVGDVTFTEGTVAIGCANNNNNRDNDEDNDRDKDHDKDHNKGDKDRDNDHHGDGRGGHDGGDHGEGRGGHGS